ncbi:carboxymuconolactone decarboxylase family protein [Amycolatopsis jejuensis]|uniref:carboxymuconolactone decarboxylase family protein n=1 Tax=Amycolatopsis jejuensis TaxID=330084 RepID=UPI000689C094|nr:carboxymuconolactone decarboxylase family protein [Amycolatopsis jejuensis]
MRTPRLLPLPAAEWDDSVRELVAARADDCGAVPNIFTTFARHPQLFRRWLPFGGELLTKGLLPPRDRELMILRSAWQCRSDYEWGQHEPIARAAGLENSEIERVPAGPGADGWREFDRVLLSAVDELHADARIADRTWTRLAQRYDERQLIELVMLIGHYHLVAFALNSFGVQRETGIADLPTGHE